MKTILSAASLVAALAVVGPAHAGGGIKAGMLTCSLENRTNVVVFSKAQYSCTLKSSNNALSDQEYTGEIKRYGADLEWKANETLVWAVIAKTTDMNNSSLRGDYVGAGADAALGIGVGAKVLVGGLNKAFALQPLSASGSEGIGASLGVDHFKLR